MAIHAHALDLINNSGAILVSLGTCFRDLAPHVLEEVFRKTLLLCHLEVLYVLLVG
jgi:hypothetical protein